MAPLIVTSLVLLASIHSSNAVPTSHRRATTASSIPDYALTYAPHVYISGTEQWFPSDIATHVEHVSMEYDYVNVSTSVTLETLTTYNSSIYMTSVDNVEDDPEWLLATYGKPDADTGYSAAPGTIIAVQKTVDGEEVVDVFYFFFYSYNHGTKVLGTMIDNHVGDWEHAMIRFSNGEPQNVYLSAHTSGAAYAYSAMTLEGVRPVTYSAVGTHANYATSGSHSIYSILGNLVTDTTSAGYYWDITQNYRGYWFDDSTSTFTSVGGVGIGASEEVGEGVDWLSWLGFWGDEEYPRSDSRQDCVLDLDELCHYESGPTGPLGKNLGRSTPCESNDDCDIKTSL
ncbi:hypothetical protein AAFC00_000057 [Neodothiora populina]|uniref:Vacuolar protein sorting-associated protein 62 n=1 Tax=Neodothiora populina TaxID=2781224 RepID=A0ABR3P1L4_9PEZI